MHRLERTRSAARQALLAAAAWGAVSGIASAQPNATYYQCPGNVFTNTISAKEAESRKCTAREAKEPTTIAGPTRPRTATPGPVASSPASARVDPAAQRTRDTDARRILDSELKTEEERLAALQKDYNNGEPERQGGERNYQKYLDRVAEMKAAIARKESDIAAIRRELLKLPK